MLQAKFGDRYHEVPALWFWTRFNREKGGNKKECKGYIHGGYRRIVEALSESIKAQGGTIKLQASIEKVDLNAEGRLSVLIPNSEVEVFDRVVITTPISFFNKANASLFVTCNSSSAVPTPNQPGRKKRD